MISQGVMPDFGSLRRDQSRLESAENQSEPVRLGHVIDFQSLFLNSIPDEAFARRLKRWYTTGVGQAKNSK